MEFAFVMARAQNHFFVEVVEAIRDELDQLDVESSLHLDGYPPERDGLVYVLVPPHEWFSLEGWRRPPSTSQLARSIFICAEQPETAFFTDDARLGRLAGAVFDINAGSITEFERLGLDGVRHFPLGWTRSWARGRFADDGLPAEGDRDIDVLHLGIFSRRRAKALGHSARWLADKRCRLLLGDDHKPNYEEEANFAVSDTKWDLLARAKVLLNVHVAERPYFESLRVVQAIACGCAVVSEHSIATEPLRPGDHFVTGRAEVLGLLARDLLRNESYRAQMARRAHSFLREERPLARSVLTLIQAGGEILATRAALGAPTERPLPELTAPKFDKRTVASTSIAYPHAPGDVESSVVRAALKDTRLELLETRRELRRLRLEGRSRRPVPAIEIDRRTAAYTAATPRISVITPLYNYEHHIQSALESVANARYRNIEVIVVDDGSTDLSLAAARRFVARNQGLPLLLLRHPVNRGLGPARNAGLDFARGEFAFMLDADNEIYCHALDRLIEALNSSADADAAYGMLERFTGDGPDGLLSQFPWQPSRFRTGNYIDAMALWRTRALRRLGGFTTDIRLHGWEDYDLWCRLAERGGRAVMVPEIVGRYRVSRHSMLSLTNISDRAAVSLLVERNPRVMSGVEPPP